ncbi:hypothetical protein [Methylobacterium sp. B1]|uniref:hypothetical protein n=1 Tax=Methylobacterium sp. B1 TaxID=91459 RepID=UPI000348E0F2|nr:hypothetical protein [Methylobacterium sp. B1]
MNFVHRYLGESRAVSDADATRLGFVPDTLREPTYFAGTVARHLPFREAISALHHVVVSDLRFKPKDRTAYFAWLQAHEQELLAEALAEKDSLRAEIEALRAEHRDIAARSDAVMRPFYDARKRYFDYLYRENFDAWIVLDPVITVHPDEVFFEAFSLDESSYGRLSCDHDTFARIGDMACGTTNIDYSHALYDEFQKIRSYRDTELAIDPTGFAVQTSGEAAYREDKIELPDSWMRGFLQVSSAMAQPAHVVDLHPVDMHAILTRLAARRERHGPRALRFLLEPGRPVSVLIEPWNERLTFRRSIYRGGEARGDPPVGPAAPSHPGPDPAASPGRCGCTSSAPACRASRWWISAACASPSACRAGPPTTGPGPGSSTCSPPGGRSRPTPPPASSRRSGATTPPGPGNSPPRPASTGRPWRRRSAATCRRAAPCSTSTSGSTACGS